MKPRLNISVAYVALLFTAATAFGLTAEGETETGSFSDINSETIRFRILGVASSNRPGQTLAIIESDQGSQGFIREGDIIGELSVKKILSDRVVFDTRKGERIARLNRGYLEIASATATQALPEVVSVRQPPEINEKIVEVDGEEVSNSLADIDAVVRQVNISPIAVYDEPIGIRIYPIAPDSIFEQLGLETGDIITAVNGEEIRKPEEAIAFLEQIRTGGDFDISIRGPRRDTELHLIIN